MRTVMRGLDVTFDSWIEMISVLQPRRDRTDAVDTIDVALEISWIASEIAVDVIGMFFWSALVLLFVQAIV